jgi:hypothetical protein
MIKNNLLGGQDFTEGSVLYAADLIDTFDELVRQVEEGY